MFIPDGRLSKLIFLIAWLMQFLCTTDEFSFSITSTGTATYEHVLNNAFLGSAQAVACFRGAITGLE